MKRNWSESDIQSTCITLARYKYGKELFFSVPNGAHLYGSDEQKAKQMNKLKREGLQAGVSDLVFFHKEKKPLFVEMKSKAGKQSESQSEFENKVESGFGYYVIIDSFGDFEQLLKNYYGY